MLLSKLYDFSDFAHSLIYHSAPGCTFVFNEAARKKVIQYDIDNEYAKKWVENMNDYDICLEVFENIDYSYYYEE